MVTTIPIHPTHHVYLPEDNPFETVMVDVTHRCNMGCFNCYIPNREIPDLDLAWILSILERLPQRTRIRIVGAEPTMRSDLTEIIAGVRAIGHLPILMTNGLKLANGDYLKMLKAAGLRSVYLSLNGGENDEAYKAIDGQACAKPKLQALQNLVDLNMYVSLGMIVVRGINEDQIQKILDRIRSIRQVYEYHLRSIGQFGRYMESDSFTLSELADLFAQSADLSPDNILSHREHPEKNYIDFKIGKLKIQLTQWPDYGSTRRGRLSPDGTIQPFFEHMALNEGGY